MSRVVELGNGRKVMMLDDEAEAWDLANKIISDLRGKYNLNEPEGVADLRAWMDEMSYRVTHTPVIAVKTATAKEALWPSSHAVETIVVPAAGRGLIDDAEAMTYIPAGATYVGREYDMARMLYTIAYTE